MEISNDTLSYLSRETTCPWTRGFIACLLNSAAPTRNEIARELIESCGTNKIGAIKIIRNNYGLGLKEAKAVVDEYDASGQIVGLPQGDEPDPGAAGVPV